MNEPQIMNTSDSGLNPYVSKLFDLSQALAVPFAQKLAGQKMDATTADRATLAERIEWSRLNGSGPNDPREAIRAPQGTLDFITGQTGPNGQATGPNFLWLAIAGLGGLLLFITLRK